MAISAFAGRAASATGPAGRLAGVTPDDAADLPGGVSRSIFVGVAGVVRVMDAEGGVTDLLSGASQYHPIRARRILATGTTASAILALY